MSGKSRLKQPDRAATLGEQPILSLLYKFSAPAIIGMLVNATYTVVDRMFVGKGVGDSALAAVALCMPVNLVMMAFNVLVGIGMGNIISIRLGEGRRGQAKRTLNTGFLLAISISLTLTTLGMIFFPQILSLLGADSPVERGYASSYLRIIVLGSVFQAVSMALNNAIRATGSPGTAMLTMLLGAIMNIVLDPLFIFVFKWGVTGAALATIISQIATTVWVVSFLSSRKSIVRLNPRFFALKWEYIKDICSIGLSPFALQIAASLVTFAINAQCKRYGLQTLGEGGDVVALTSITATNSINMFILMPIFGINHGMQPIVGYNYGAKKFDRVLKAYGLGSVFATVISTFGFLISMIFAPQLMLLFSNGTNELILEFGTKTIRTTMMCLPIVGFQVVSQGYFNSCGKPVVAGFITLSRQIVFLLPLMLVLPVFFQLEGIIYAIPGSDLLSTVITAAMAFRETRIIKSGNCL